MTLRAAVIGLGWWGKQITQCLAGSAEIRVTHGVDVAAASLEGFARAHELVLRDSLEAVLGDANVDAVIVATPHSQHEAQVLAAIAAGKQVFCEKPLTLTAAAAERMLAAAERARIVLGIGHERRFEPGLEEVARRVHSGELGKLLHLEANVSHNLFAAMDASNWRVNAKDAPAGAMTALGIHLSDFFICLAGRPRRVIAHTAKVLPTMVGDDHVAVRIEFESGVAASFTCLSSTPYHGRLTAFGSAGWIEVKENANVDKGLPSDVTVADATGARSMHSYAAINTVLLNLEAWARAATGRGEYRYTRAQLLDNVRVLDAIVRSASAGGQAIVL